MISPDTTIVDRRSQSERRHASITEFGGGQTDATTDDWRSARANGLFGKLAIFGLPSSVFGNLVGGRLLVDKQAFNSVPAPVAIGRGVIVMLGIVALALLSRRITRSWRIDR